MSKVDAKATDRIGQIRAVNRFDGVTIRAATHDYVEVVTYLYETDERAAIRVPVDVWLKNGRCGRD